MYVTLNEMALLRIQIELRAAQEMLASARRGTCSIYTVECERHVTRLLDYTWTAQQRVYHERQQRLMRRMPPVPRFENPMVGV